jgi:hypothetical protein
MMILAELSDQALTGRLLQVRKAERRLLVECLGCLAELDRRKAVLSLGYGSLFSFCTEFLSMTKASAFRRTTAARLLARFPVVAQYLADGRLNLTTLVELRDVLDEAHLVEILDRTAGRTEDQVKELVASLRPQPAPADLLRRLPSPRNDSTGSGPAPAAPAAPAAANGPRAALAAPAAFSPPPVAAPSTAVQVATPLAARLHPIAPELHVLRVTVSAEFVASLEAARRALSHKLPSGELAEVLHEGSVRSWRTQTGGAAAPVRSPPPQPCLHRAAATSPQPCATRCGGAMVGSAHSSAAPAVAAPPSTSCSSITPLCPGWPVARGEPLPSLQEPPRCRTGLRPCAYRSQGRRPAGARSFPSDAPAPPGPALVPGCRSPRRCYWPPRRMVQTEDHELLWLAPVADTERRNRPAAHALTRATERAS